MKIAKKILNTIRPLGRRVRVPRAGGWVKSLDVVLGKHPLALAALFLFFSVPFIQAQAAAPLIERWTRSSPNTETVYNVSSVTWRLAFDQWVDDVDTDFRLENCSGCKLRVSPSNGQGSVFHVTVFGDALSDRNHSVELSIRSDHDIRNADGERLPTDKRYGTIVHEPRYIVRNKPYVLRVLRSFPTSYETNSNSVSWTYEFSEPMDDVEASDFYLQQTTATLSLTDTQDDRIFTLMASGGDLSSLNREIRIWPERNHNMKDKSGHPLVTRVPVHSDQTRFRLDNERPLFRYLERHDPSGQKTTGHSVTFLIKFNEAVVPHIHHFWLLASLPPTIGDVIRAYATSVTKYENRTDEYLVNFSDLRNVQQPVVMLHMRPNLVPDIAGNTSSGTLSYSDQNELDFYETQFYDVDNRHPYITLANLGDYSTVRNPYFRMDWNEDVTGFEASDVRVDGGSIASFNDDEERDRKFGMRLTADREGSVTIAVRENAAKDGHENESVAFSKTVVFDWTAPGVNSIVRQSPTAWATNSDTLRWRVTLSESVTGVDAADFGLSGTTAGLRVTEVRDSSRTQYEVSASGGNLGSVNGIVKLAFRDPSALTVTDIAGNALVNTTPTGSIKDTYRLDNSAPTVAIEGVPATASGPFTATLRFSEAVTGFGQSDIAATGATLSDLKVTEDGREWTVRVTPNADYRLAVSAGAATDYAGNTSLANDGEGARGILLAAGAGLVITPASLTIAEGSSGTFTVALAAVPTATLTVTLSSNNSDVKLDQEELNFTTSNWNTPITVTVSAAEDADAANESATLTVDPSGGGYDAVADASVAVTVTDRDARLKVAPVSLTMPEGSSESFTVALAALPTGPVTVTLSLDNADVTLDDETLTFTTSDWNVPQSVRVVAAADEDAGDDRASVGLALSGGGYDGVSGGSVSVTVTDDDAGLIVAPANLTIAEGSSGTFTVALAALPVGPVTVALTSDHDEVTLDKESLTFTPSDWDTPQTVTASAVRDVDAEDDRATLGLDPSGGGYDRLADGSLAVTVNDADLSDAGLTVIPTRLTIPEGSSERFTVALATAPQGPVTVPVASSHGEVTTDPTELVFTPSDWNVAQTVTVSVDEDADEEDESATLGLDPSGGGYDGLAEGSVLVTVTDTQITDAGLVMAPESLTLAEGSSGSFTVVLAAPPKGPVTVAVWSDHDEVDVSPAELVFTLSDWNVTRTLTVSAAEDSDEEAESATLTLDPSGGGYDDLAAGSLAVTVTDGQVSGAGLIMQPESLTLAEGSSGSFTVALAALPKGPVTVAISSDHGDLTTSPAELVFTPTNWDVAQTVTVRADEDSDEEEESATLTLDPSGGGYDDLADGALPVTVIDGQVTGGGLVIEPRSLTLAEGSSGSFAVALEVLPKGPVTVTLSSDHGDVTTSPTELVFTPSDWNVAQTVRVSVAEDGDETHENATLTVDPSGGGYDAVVSGSVAVRVEDGPASQAQAERRLAEPALVDVGLDTLSGMSAAMRGRFGGCESALTLAGETVRSGDSESEAGDGDGERQMTPAEALGASAFRWSAGCGGAKDRSWTVWGHGDHAHFGGSLAQGRYDGSLSTAWLGVDRYVSEYLVAGAALSRGQGSTDFDRFGLAEETTELTTRLTVGWPYVRLETRGGGALQLVLGVGSGTAEYRREGQRTEEASLDALLASVSGEAPLWRGEGLSLRATGALEVARVKTGGGASGVLGGLRAEGTRLRAGLEAERSAFRLGTLSLAPHGAVAVAHDAGDGLDGTGLELSGGFRVATADPRFGLSASTRWLALHSADRRRHWGASVEAVWKATSNGRGLSLSLAPTWGLQGEGALQGSDIFANLEDERSDGGAALASRLDYGMATSRGGLFTPFVELAVGESRRLTTGTEFEWGTDFLATFTGERRETPDRTPDHRLGLDLRLRF